MKAAAVFDEVCYWTVVRGLPVAKNGSATRLTVGAIQWPTAFW